MKDKEMNPAMMQIKAHLDKIASQDDVFAAKYANEKKSLDECFQYILTEAHKRGNAVCMTDDEVYGLAMHYYDEENVEIQHVSLQSAHYAPSTKVELTAEEQAEVDAEAKRRIKEMMIKKQVEMAQKQNQPKKKSAPADKEQPIIPTLF